MSKNDAAAGNVTTSETTAEYAVEATTPEPETTVRKDISEYEDRTIEIPGNTFKEIAENPNLIPVITTTCSGYSLDTIGELYQHSKCVMRGRIIDLTYAEEGKFGGTFYSFAVEEVLCGEEIEAETIVSVLDSQGYMRLEAYREAMETNAYPQYSGEEADRTYLVRTSGEPMVEIGEEYILFIYNVGSTWNGKTIEGSYYYVPFLGKFKLNDEGLYERFIPEFERHLYKLVDPLSLEEIKEQIAEAEKNKNNDKRQY